MTSALRPHTVGEAIDVPHITVYEVSPLLEQEVTPPSPPTWQPGALTSGLSRPSSAGPHELKLATPSVSELMAPTTIAFLLFEGGAVVWYVPPQRCEPCRSLPAAQTMRRGVPSDPPAMESISTSVTP